MKNSLTVYVFFSLLVGSACGAVEDRLQQPPLACASSVEGDRLVVTCNRAVSTVPEACELETSTSTYRCNWLHASAEQCAAFPGICE